MEGILDKLFLDYVRSANKPTDITVYEAVLENNKKLLKRKFSKRQKKLLIRIEDSKDSISEINSQHSFNIGLKLGLAIGYEVNTE